LAEDGHISFRLWLRKQLPYCFFRSCHAEKNQAEKGHRLLFFLSPLRGGRVARLISHTVHGSSPYHTQTVAKVGLAIQQPTPQCLTLVFKEPFLYCAAKVLLAVISPGSPSVIGSSTRSYQLFEGSIGFSF
jgi:hypothetical protein